MSDLIGDVPTSSVRGGIEPPEKWRFDKKIPLPAIFTLLAIAATSVWGYSKMDSRVDYVESRTMRLEQHDEQKSSDESKVEARLASIEGLLRLLVENYQQQRQGH